MSLLPPIPLALLQTGERAVIDTLVGHPKEVLRLEELGFRAGQIVEMVQPGTPCIVRVGGNQLCFRQTEALGILLRVSD